MYLKKIELSGFKSFANKTIFDFSSRNQQASGRFGVTAIVGPNGSGKSNVCDAVRWVMGEQSMKSLRGKKTEDVIFSGSQGRGRLSAAHVVLHFDNTDKRLPLPYEEVRIGRKVYRSGESEYLINGSRARLQDVIELLGKAGIGKASHCVLTQGMADAVLNATPEERRQIIEDAAGVKIYQIKKEQALRKFDRALENLERVGGLIQELEPHVKTLKRQAERAQKGEIIAKELNEKQRILYAVLWHRFGEDHTSLMDTKQSQGVAVGTAQRTADKLSDALEKESNRLQEADEHDDILKEREDAQKRLHELERELSMAKGRMDIERERQAYEEEKRSIPVDLKYVKKKLEDITLRYRSLAREIEQVKALDDITKIKDHAEELKNEITVFRQNVEQGEVVVEDPDAEAKRVKAEQDKKDRIEALSASIEKLETDVPALRESIVSCNERLQQAMSKSHDDRQKFFELEKELRDAQQALSVEKDRFNEITVELAKVDVRGEDLKQEIQGRLHMEPEHLQAPGEDVDTDHLSRKVEKLRQQLDHIGGIDPMVLEEYQEMQERYDFLEKESVDLREAIEKLTTVVREMEQKIETAFEGAYDVINKEFQTYFSILFGGGKAQLRRISVSKRKKQTSEEQESELGEEETSSDTPERSKVGIEIYACPPGKKITNLSLLSGGERTLTSLALLFAIISFNPPPFAVLDEVEAPLDEANSRRFGNILKQLSKQTQFVTITHNRETMRHAHLLYGITMQNDGSSRVLSVQLDAVGEDGLIKETPVTS